MSPQGVHRWLKIVVSLSLATTFRTGSTAVLARLRVADGRRIDRLNPPPRPAIGRALSKAVATWVLCLLVTPGRIERLFLVEFVEQQAMDIAWALTTRRVHSASNALSRAASSAPRP